MTSRERTIKKYYKDAILILQYMLDLTDNILELRQETRKVRPRFYRKEIWEETIDEIADYVKNHKENFKEGKLYA